MKTANPQLFAGELEAGSAARPAWLTRLAYGAVFAGLVYFIATAKGGGLNGPNPVFAGLLAFWLVYTPLANRKNWFAIRL
ncbi:MAG: hypothetical protein ACE5G8_03505 [Anaerolineae bacterium]